MKNLIIAVIALFTLNSIAQEKEVKKISVKTNQRISSQNQSPEARAKIETEKLTNQLELSSEQHEKVHTIMLEHFTKNQDMRQSVKKKMAVKEKISKTEIKEAIVKKQEENFNDLNNRLKEVLSEEQFKKYQQNNKALKSRKEVMVKKN